MPKLGRDPPLSQGSWMQKRGRVPNSSNTDCARGVISLDHLCCSTFQIFFSFGRWNSQTRKSRLNWACLRHGIACLDIYSVILHAFHTSLYSYRVPGGIITPPQ